MLIIYGMSITRKAIHYGQGRIVRKMLRAVPWLGGVVALVGLGQAMRRKGFLGGSLHTALDVIPYVGGAKNLAEMARGRDFIRDRQPQVRTIPARDHNLAPR